MFGTRINETKEVTKKDQLQREFDSAEHVYREMAESCSRLDAQVRGERRAIDDLTAKYDAACRQLAIGEDTETASILSERERHAHKLRGLEALLKESNERLQPLHAAQEAAARALQAELDREEMERLEAVLVDACAKRDAAEAALNEAEKAVRSASYLKEQFRRKLELRYREGELLQQRRA
jgi:hypothetical protein